jgi:hypothetical protein
MNKKLLFAAMSLAALTACTDNDFESQKVAEEVGSVHFELLNNDAQTRASMGGTSGTKVVWNANDGDLFTLYFGAEADKVKGFENACYKAEYGDDKATLSTPTMIKEGRAIMVWPVDTTFRIKTTDALTLTIPEVLKAKKDGKGGIENAIPYVSDLINIGAYNKLAPYNTAGKDRTYPVYMRPMGSILKLKADWDGMDKIKALTELAEDPIAPITLTSVKLMTDDAGTTKFTQKLPIKWTDPTTDITGRWDNAHTNRAWEKVTDFDVATATGVAELTTECIDGTELAQFIILPQTDITGGVAKAAVDVNTYYGRVLVATNADYPGKGKYTDDEYNKAWYRYLSTKAAESTEENASDATAETSGDNAGKYKTVAKSVALGMQQTINFFSNYKSKSGVVKDEPTGTAVSRYVKVYLKHLDMSGLHITSDKQLRDVVRVWKELGLPAVEVILDGDKTKHEFEISQQTIAKINEINNGTLNFKVKPCSVPHVDGVDDEFCNTIVITGGGDVKDIAFIAANGTQVADVAFNAGETWNWKGAVKVTKTGVNRFINRGTMVNTEGATLKTTENDGTQNNVVLVNNGTWNISGGKLFVQFDVTNIKEVNIAKGAEYRQDNSKFTNSASDVPTRFGGNDSKIGKVENKGVFATVNGGKINNVGLIEHADKDAKTYITTNQTGGDFATAFGGTNKMGTINLPYSNKEEDNISIDAAADKGFVSVTVSATDAPADGILNADVVGARVNYINVTGGITTIATVSPQVKYVEINEPGTEIAWALTTTPALATYEGLMVLSPVNIKLNTEIQVTKACYLGADMYVGGKFNNGTPGTYPSWSGYFGDTSANFATMYVTYK